MIHNSARLLVHNTSVLSGLATPPSSKSHSIRALLFALLAKGESVLMNPLDCGDVQDAMRICGQLGANLNLDEDRLSVNSVGLPLPEAKQIINSGNSGISTHFVMPLLGLRKGIEKPIILDCGEQMRARPIVPLVETLRVLGLRIDYLDKEGQLPISVCGQLRGGIAEVDGITSQYLSALLVSLPCASMDSEITVRDLHERPYVEMTLAWLKKLDIRYQHVAIGNRDIYHIPGRQNYSAFKATIAGDFSSASYLIAAAVLGNGRVELRGLDMQDPQGDKRLVYLLQEMGAAIEINAQGLMIEGGRSLTGLTIDADDIPDLLPALAVIGTYAQGKTEIINVRQARIKETDRIHSMSEGLSRMGAKVEVYEDGMTLYPSALHGATVKGYNDHRTVMALAIAGLRAEGQTEIEDVHAVNKTFPNFVSLMRSLGAKMEVMDGC
jgi:3-phosphoshikimate 1-carboxyvinyltransferase